MYTQYSNLLLASTPTGGIRGTSFIHSPLLASKGRVSMDLMHLSDWLPTLYGRAGGDVSNLDIDGYDMWPTLSEGQASPRQELVHNIDPVTWTAAVRYHQWKLLVNESKNVFFCFTVIIHSTWRLFPREHKGSFDIKRNTTIAVDVVPSQYNYIVCEFYMTYPHWTESRIPTIIVSLTIT